MNEAWTAMLRSVEKRRDVDARFYKPTCLLAVIDGIADGSLAPSDLDPDRVITRFRDYLQDLFPERASLGWRPFWHLSRDGAWIFSREGRQVGPEDFKRQRKPNSRRELMSRIDHVSVPAGARPYWLSATARAELRVAVIAMLRRDDDACRRVADHLDPDGAFFTQDLPTSGQPLSALAGGTPSRQGFRQSSAARRAVESRAMAVAQTLLEAEGWVVEDVSTRRSYDLHCTRDGESRYVEVKGTAGAGEEIQLTAAEVTFAALHREQMVLIVVTGIQLDIDEDAPNASGGTAHVLKGWAPDPGDLRPISYFCRIVFPG